MRCVFWTEDEILRIENYEDKEKNEICLLKWTHPVWSSRRQPRWCLFHKKRKGCLSGTFFLYTWNKEEMTVILLCENGVASSCKRFSVWKREKIQLLWTFVIELARLHLNFSIASVGNISLMKNVIIQKRT